MSGVWMTCRGTQTCLQYPCIIRTYAFPGQPEISINSSILGWITDEHLLCLLLWHAGIRCRLTAGVAPRPAAVTECRFHYFRNMHSVASPWQMVICSGPQQNFLWRNGKTNQPRILIYSLVAVRYESCCVERERNIFHECYIISITGTSRTLASLTCIFSFFWPLKDTINSLQTSAWYF